MKQMLKNWSKHRRDLKERWDTHESYNRWAEAKNRMSRMAYDREDGSLSDIAAEVYDRAVAAGGTVSSGYYRDDGRMTLHFTCRKRPARHGKETRGEIFAHTQGLTEDSRAYLAVQEMPENVYNVMHFMIQQDLRYWNYDDGDGGIAVLVEIEEENGQQQN